MHVTIGASPTFASKWLIPRLPEFTNEHPDIELRILASESIANFQSDGVDIAVRQGRPPFGANLLADLLFEQELVAVHTIHVFWTPPRSFFLPEAVDRVTLLNDAHDLWPEFIERALGRQPSATIKRLRFSLTSLALDAAVAGQELALAASFLVEQEIKAGRLAQAFSQTTRGRMDSCIVSLRRPRNLMPTSIVRQWLLAQGQRV